MSLLSKTLTNPQVADVKVGALLLSPENPTSCLKVYCVCPYGVHFSSIVKALVLVFADAKK